MPRETVEPPPAFRILSVIPTLGKRLETLERTLSSLKDQAGVTVDILIVAPTIAPELKSIAEKYAARLLTHPGRISAAVNAGFAQATGAHKYACWLGDDDMLRPGALAEASALLEAHPAAAVAYGPCDYIDIDGNFLFCRRPPPFAPTLLQIVPGLIKQESCLFRLSGLRQVGGLDETLHYTMDLDLLLKLRRVGSFQKTNRVLAAFCWHPNSLTIANRQVSLTQAQDVQRVHARGLLKLSYPLWKPAIRALILFMTWKINRDMGGGNPAGR